MRLCLCLFVVLFLIPSLALAQCKRRAVVVGVAGFEHGYASLEYTARDARRTATALEDLGYSVSLLAADADAGEVRYADVLSAPKSAADRSQPGDTLLFFFAGHGSRRMNKDYLLLSDSDPDRFESTALAVDTLSDIVAACKATERVFVIDACRSTSRADGKTGFGNGKLDKEFKNALDKLVATQAPGGDVQTSVLYACSPGETSKESVEERAGIFTQRFVRALQQSNKNSALTLASVFHSVRSQMPSTIRQTPLLVGPGSLHVGDPARATSTPAVGRPGMPGRTDAGGPIAGSRINPKDSAEMVLIPSQDFEMGAETFRAQEGPIHKVHLSGYYIYRNVVTVRQYKRFVADMKRKGLKIAGHDAEMPPEPDALGIHFNPGWMYENHPMVNVSWNDATEYCRWAGVTLPTEAQWEHAAQGPLGYRFPWGNTYDPAMLWTSNDRNGDLGGTGAIGQFPANGYGLYDMAGNVRQWCLDYFDPAFYRNHNGPWVDPINRTPPANNARALRCDTWLAVDEFSSYCAYRYGERPEVWVADIGFRCAAPADFH